MSVTQNIEKVREQMKLACQRSGRSEEVDLVAVTKFATIDQVHEVMACGVKKLGENRAQVLLEKYDSVDKSAEWNFIGHLQTNKVKSIVNKVNLIQSLDRLSLAREIDHQAKAHELVMPVLIQVNIAKEDVKYGINEEELEQLVGQVQQCKNIELAGLMAIMPLCEAEGLRQYFAKMYKLYQKLKSQLGETIKYLSMGMTNDYKVAIEEGANVIRVGSAIFNQ